MWPFRRRKEVERRHDEALRLEREAVRLAERSLSIARENKRVQVIATALALAGIVVSALLAWQPWSSSPVARAQVSLNFGSHNAVVPKRVRDLPPPPGYPDARSGDHCRIWWTRWLPQQGAAEETNPTIQISAPSSADVTVARATVQVFRSVTPPEVTYVQCLKGAGPVSGTRLNVDLDHPHAPPTIVADDGRNTPLAIPNAVINIEPGHTEFVAAHPHGGPRLYEWSLGLQLIVDQRAQTVVFGSRDQPLRSWLGHIPAAAYDYDIRTHRWRRAY